MRDSTRYEKVEEAPGITDGGLFGPYKFIRLKSGRQMTFWDAIRDAESAESSFVRGISRGFKMMSSEFDLEALERRIDHMEEYVTAVRHFLKKKRAEQTTREKIAQLRNTNGRTPEEMKAFNKKADELERQLDNE